MTDHSIFTEPSLSKDAALSLFVGECLGTGWQRHTYAVRGRDDLVIKIENGPGFNNVTEWLIWQAVKDSDVAEWFAPCLHISEDGKALIQVRTKPFYGQDHFQMNQAEVPDFFSDVHWGNWGFVGLAIKCHDYARHAFILNGITKYSMIEVPDK